MKKLFIISLLLLFISNSILFGQNRGDDPKQTEKKAQLEKQANQLRQKLENRKAEAIKVANEKGWPLTIQNEDGSYLDIQYIDDSGMPQYYTTTNINAARTTNTDDLWTGGSSGLNLDGNGFEIGEWDAGGVITTHQEFNDASGTRVTQGDSPAATHYHSTHVAGTLIAEGQVAAAKGMAHEANLTAYDWDSDYAEMASEASGGLTVSNHSYAWNRGWTYNSTNGYYYWYGNPSISSTEDYLFGFYDESSQDLDNLVVNAPHYLPVWAAANDRNDDYNSGHYVYSGGSWTWSTASRDQDGGADGYDCIPQQSVAKNILTVGAVNDITSGWSQASDVVMSTFSGWGPTDDGRIKPDICANGVSVYSTDDDSNSDYRYLDGTSMASPNTTGTLALLQDYYQDLNGGQMSAATLKGLVINTANEAGPADGPDYMFGWGLLNATGAADLITLDHSEGGLIVEAILENGQTTDYTYYSDGSSDINVTICWTDPAGTPVAAALNPTNLMLVNELDVRLYHSSSTYFPWRLNPASPSSNATKGDNFRDNVETVNIQSPSAGYYTIRVNHGGTLSGGQQAYALIVSGLSTPGLNNYCSANSTSWSSYEYIQNVSMGDIDNTTGRSSGGYGDYSGLVTSINKGASQTINVTINGYAGDQGKAWVDWNQDGDFTDTGEEFTLGTDAGPYNATITAPADALSGYTKMRVRLTYSGSILPCGSTSYGEIEDYSIFVVGTPGLWTGAVSTDWHTAGNWDDLAVPNSTVNVVIPGGTPNQPSISGGNAYANNLIIEAGATLTQIGTSYLYVYGYFNSDFGTFTQSGLAYLYFSGSTNTYWDDDNEDDTYNYVRVTKSDPAYSVNMYQDMTVLQNFEVREGTFQIDALWTLNVLGSSANTFQVESGGVLRLIDESINVPNGDFDFEDGSNVIISGGNLFCGSDFRVRANATNDLSFTGTTLTFIGGNVNILEDLDGNTTFNNLTINKTSNLSHINTNVHIGGDVTITAGTLNGGTFDMTVGGNWTNTGGTFSPGTGSVIFESNGSPQDVTGSNTFYDVQQINTGNYLRFYGNTTINNNLEVNYFTWAYTNFNVNGILDITNPSSKFTASGSSAISTIASIAQGGSLVCNGAATIYINNLVENAIEGSYSLSDPDGSISIVNSSYVDLNGDINITDGTMTVSGTVSYWPYTHDASIIMSGGVLDFTDCGITIYNSGTYTLNDNITGGVIRTAGGFNGQRADFTPNAGIFEFYGTSDATFNQSNGCTLYEVAIDKDAKSITNPSVKVISTEERADNTVNMSDVSQISLVSDFSITSDLNIYSGTLRINGHELIAQRNTNVYGTLIMDNPLDVITSGTTYYHQLRFYYGSEGNLANGNINAYGWVIPVSGCSFNATPSNTISFIGVSGGGPSNEEPTAVYGNIIINKNAGGTAYIDNSATETINVSGNLTVNPDNTFEMQDEAMIVAGSVTDNTSSTIYLYNAKKEGSADLKSSKPSKSTFSNPNENGSKAASLEIDGDYTVYGLLDISDGSALIHGNFGINSTGELTITTGSLVADQGYAKGKAWQYLDGTINMSGGLFEISSNSMRFSSTSVNNISDGIIRCGFTFYAAAAGIFQPTGGTVEMTGNLINSYILNDYASGNYFYNLTINKDNETVLHSDIEVKNDIIIEKGLNVFGLSVDHDIYVGGNWTNNGGEAAFNEGNGAVIFNGATYSDILTDETFYDLVLDKSDPNFAIFELMNGLTATVLNNLETIDGSFELNMNSTLIVENDIILRDQSGLNAYGDTGLSIFVGGDFTDENALWDTQIGYSPGTEIVTFNGTTDQVISTNATKEDFGNITIDKNSGQFRPASNIDVMGNLLISNGQWSDNISGLTHYFEGDFDVEPSGAFFTHISPNTVTFKETYDQTITYNGAGGYFRDIVIDKTPWGSKEIPEGGEKPSATQTNGSKATTVSLATTVYMQGGNGLTIDEGTLDLNGNYLATWGTININDGGILIVDHNSHLAIHENEILNVNNGGLLQIEGSAGSPASILKRFAGTYSFNVNSGGTISAEYGEFTDMNLNGVYVSADAIVDPAHAFNYCTFGASTSGYATKLIVNNNQNLVSTGVNFPTSDGTQYNVWKALSSSGTITFNNATGDFAGPEFEYDPTDGIHWGPTDLTVGLTAILEGPYNGINMNTDLNTLGLIPNNQPFNSNPAANWYYTGSEAVASIPANVVDWVLVQIRDASDASTALGNVVAEQAAFILNDGSIVDLDGASNLEFSGVTYSNGLYPVVYHRNHLGAISSVNMVRSGGIFEYDFTQSGAAYFNTGAGTKNLGGGVFGLFGGDASGGGVISPYDIGVWQTQAGLNDYLSGEFNLDGQADNKDKNDVCIPNIGNESQIPGGKGDDK
jgi:hypothetical protein